MVGEAKMSAITVFSTNRKKKRYTQLDWSQVQGGIIYDRILYFYGGLFFSSCPSQQTYNTRKRSPGNKNHIQNVIIIVRAGRKKEISYSIELLLLCTPGLLNERKEEENIHRSKSNTVAASQHGEMPTHKSRSLLLRRRGLGCVL
jgi:hypothetical protein